MSRQMTSLRRCVIRTAAGGLALAAMFAVLAPDVAQARELVLYTASNPQIEKEIMAAFKSKNPDIELNSVNDSTGPMTERTIAEKENPQADVIWMINNIALDQLKEAGALEPYEPKGSPIGDAFRDPDGFWVAHNATVMGLAVNTKRLKEENLPMPTTWEDLIKPVYKGQITIAAATKSAFLPCDFVDSKGLDVGPFFVCDAPHHRVPHTAKHGLP